MPPIGSQESVAEAGFNVGCATSGLIPQYVTLLGLSFLIIFYFLLGRIDIRISRHIRSRNHRVGHGAACDDAVMEYPSAIRFTQRFV